MNRTITSHLKHEDYCFPMHKSYYKLLQELLVSKGESANLYSILAPDCRPSHLVEQESRKFGWVKFYVAAIAAGATISTLPDVNSCEDLDTSSIEIA